MTGNIAGEIDFYRIELFAQLSISHTVYVTDLVSFYLVNICPKGYTEYYFSFII